MKKIVAIIMSLLMTLVVSAHNPSKLIGNWNNGKVEFTFTKDSLYIDEIDIEGDVYTYKVDSIQNIIHVQSPIFEEEHFDIKILYLSNHRFAIYYIDGDDKSVYTFIRKKVSSH